jgi:ribosome assembly protein SQT1
LSEGGGDDVGYIWRYDPLAESSETASIQSYLMLSGHTDTVTNVGFNFDGTLAFTGSYDGTIRIYNVGSGEMIQVLEGPEDVEWASWHPKGNAIVAGSKDGTVWLWLAHEGRCLQVFAGHEGGVTCGGITSDGKQ